MPCHLRSIADDETRRDEYFKAMAAKKQAEEDEKRLAEDRKVSMMSDEEKAEYYENKVRDSQIETPCYQYPVVIALLHALPNKPKGQLHHPFASNFGLVSCARRRQWRNTKRGKTKCLDRT